VSGLAATVRPVESRVGRAALVGVARVIGYLVLVAMPLERHLARTPAGLVLRSAQRILALTLGMLLNTISGRQPRVLAAYDGR
jgi:hypothetical protein